MEGSLKLIGAKRNPTKGLPKRMQKSCFQKSAKLQGWLDARQCLDARPTVRHALVGCTAMRGFSACSTVVRGGTRSCNPPSCFRWFFKASLDLCSSLKLLLKSFFLLNPWVSLESKEKYVINTIWIKQVNLTLFSSTIDLKTPRQMSQTRDKIRKNACLLYTSPSPRD